MDKLFIFTSFITLLSLNLGNCNASWQKDRPRDKKIYLQLDGPTGPSLYDLGVNGSNYSVEPNYGSSGTPNSHNNAGYGGAAIRPYSSSESKNYICALSSIDPIGHIGEIDTSGNKNYTINRPTFDSKRWEKEKSERQSREKDWDKRLDKLSSLGKFELKADSDKSTQMKLALSEYSEYKNLRTAIGESDDYYEFKSKYWSQNRELMDKYKSLYTHIPSSETEIRIRHLGITSARLSDHSFSFNQHNEGLQYEVVAVQMANILSDFLPGIRTSKSIYEAFYGINPITDEELSTGERIFSGTMVMIDLVTAGTAGLAINSATRVLRNLHYSSLEGRIIGTKRISNLIVNPVSKIFDSARKGFIKAKNAIVNLPNKTKDLVRFKNNPLKNTKYHEKVRQQMDLKDYHAFPKEVDNWAGVGKRTTITGGDRLKRTRIELPGEFDGKKGHFEWIIEPNNEIRHRLFVPQK